VTARKRRNPSSQEQTMWAVTHRGSQLAPQLSQEALKGQPKRRCVMTKATVQRIYECDPITYALLSEHVLPRPGSRLRSQLNWFQHRWH
jgi:hypothetical protein